MRDVALFVLGDGVVFISGDFTSAARTQCTKMKPFEHKKTKPSISWVPVTDPKSADVVFVCVQAKSWFTQRHVLFVRNTRQQQVLIWGSPLSVSLPGKNTENCQGKSIERWIVP